MEISLELVDERTNKNTKEISKINKTLHGNGKKGVVSDISTIMANMIWLKALALLNLTAIIALVFKAFL